MGGSRRQNNGSKDNPIFTPGLYALTWQGETTVADGIKVLSRWLYNEMILDESGRPM